MNRNAEPGTIKARNTVTGVIVYARPDMLNQPALSLVRVHEDETQLGGKIEDVVIDSKREESGSQNVILTASGLPFKTEQAARTAMKRKELDENEWFVMETQDGFTIQRV